jgi:hypothetical protein
LIPDRFPLGLFVLQAVILIGIGLRLSHHFDVGSRSPDERQYSAYAGRVAAEGIGALPAVFADYQRSATNWLYPAPTRVATVLIFALPMSITGERTPDSAALVSLGASILSLGLVAWMGARFFNIWTSVLAAWFMACSFGELGMARRAWSDAPAGFFGLLVVYLACEIAARVESPRARIWFAAFLTAGFAAMLVKDATVVGYGVCGLLLALYALWDRKWRECGLIVGGGAFSAVMVLAVIVLAAGGISSGVSTLPHPGDWLVVKPSGYIAMCCSGPWWQVPAVLWATGPLTAAFVLPGVVLALRGPRKRIGGILTGVTLVYFGFASFGPAIQYLRFVSPANGCYCLLAGIAGEATLRYVRDAFGDDDWWKPIIAAAAVGIAVLGFWEYQTFRDIVVRTGMEDLAVNVIRAAMQK